MRRFQRAALIAFAVWAVHVLWLLLEIGGEKLTQAFTDVITVPVTAFVAVLCWRRGRREDRASRRAWRILSLAVAAWGAGEVVWSLYELVFHIEGAFPAPADLGFLSMLPLAAVALISFPTAARVTSRLRALLDGMIIGSSLLFVSWATILGPTFRSGFERPIELFVGVAYPLMDTALLGTVAFVFARAGRGRRGPIGLIGGGLLAIGIADVLLVFLSLHDAYASGNIIDSFWNAGFLLIGLAAVRPASLPVAPISQDARPTRLGMVMPYGAVAAALVTAGVVQTKTGSLEPFLFWNAAATVLVVVVRQLATLLDNLSLNRSLESKVDERTAELRASEERFRALVQSSSDVIAVASPRGEVTYVSQSVHRVFGYAASEVLGSNFLDLIHPDDQTTALAAFAEAHSRPGENVSMESRVRDKGGRWLRAETVITNMTHEPRVGGVVLNTRDVSERHSLQQELIHQAFHDSLTGLANRALFRDRVEHALSRTVGRAGSLSVLFLDLDGFKSVNDSFGHGVGDQLLIEAGRRIAYGIRPGDTVARLGGDEFAILLDGAGELPAKKVAERILNDLANPVALDGKEVPVAASIGIAEASAGVTAEELLRNADVAMYMAKATGKGRVELFRPEMHARVLEQLEIGQDLRSALEASEFRLVYQPVVDISSETIAGVEALIRWEHPVRGLVMPSDFVSIAEETGLIVPIGAWVLREACRQAADWRRWVRDLRMSVNISGRQLQSPDLVSHVIEALELSGLPPHALVLEITESVLMEDTTASVEILNRLHELGVGLAIDDFGTGYSSLSYLQLFPVDILKIDRSFVGVLGEHGPEDAALARAIVRIGQSLRLSTVAEGIETPAQLEELKRLGCTYGQGYLFAKPRTPADLEPLIRGLPAPGTRYGESASQVAGVTPRAFKSA